VERDLARARGLAEQEARTRTLPARAAALDRIFARARERIEARAGHPELAGVIESLVTDALAYLPPGGVSVRCAPAIAQAAAAALRAAGRDDGRVVADPTVPLGVLVESDDGRVTVDATFARRLDRERATLAAGLATALEEEQQ
jgi:vacuolar-type H+-ATPase subunit E/Vma4